MNHREARPLLADFAAGSIKAEATRERLKDHIEACPVCQVWLETYRTFSRGLGGHGNDHPHSEVLAAWATSRETLTRPIQREVLGHLRSCSECREGVRLVAAAVREARFAPRTLSPGRWTPVAAGIAAATVVVVAIPLLRRSSDSSNDLASSAFREHDRRVVSMLDRELEGRHLIEGGQSLTLRDLTVREGAEVVFRAEKSVALGGGVVIGTGTRVSFVTNAGVDGDPGRR